MSSLWLTLVREPRSQSFFLSFRSKALKVKCGGVGRWFQYLGVETGVHLQLCSESKASFRKQQRPQSQFRDIFCPKKCAFPTRLWVIEHVGWGAGSMVKYCYKSIRTWTQSQHTWKTSDMVRYVVNHSTERQRWPDFVSWVSSQPSPDSVWEAVSKK